MGGIFRKDACRQEVYELSGEIASLSVCGEFNLLKEASDDQKSKITPVIHPHLEFIPIRVHGTDPPGR